MKKPKSKRGLWIGLVALIVLVAAVAFFTNFGEGKTVYVHPSTVSSMLG